jgi:hypothetical protein
MKKVAIKLGNGDLATGFSSVNIELKQDHAILWEDICSLRAAPELKSSLQQWELLYGEIVRLNRADSYRGVVFAEQAITNVSIQDLRNLHDRLKRELNKWLAESDFDRVEKSLRTKLNADEDIIIAIRAEQKSIWQLPWYLWDFFTDYPLGVEVFSKPQNIDVSNISIQPNGKVDILALFGTDPLLNLDRDLQCWQSFSHINLQSFETTSAQDITHRLNLATPDILYISGHGESVEYESDRDGIIYLNPHTPLEISTLKPQIGKAVKLGLQIAIFNCCSGLGIAHQLSDVNIPYLIVMRAEIPNRIAQDFLEKLLSEYSNGADFVQAFQLARHQLSISTASWLRFANWLPVLFHNPLSRSVVWQDFISAKSRFIPDTLAARIYQTISAPKSRLMTSLGLSLALAGLSMGLKSIAPIQQVDNTIVDRLSQIQPTRNQNLILIEYDPTIVWGELRDPSILTDTIAKISQNAQPQAFITNSKLSKYLSTNTDRQWKLNTQALDRLESIQIEAIDRLTSAEIERKFNGKIIAIGKIKTLTTEPLTADRNDLNSDLNFLKLWSKTEDLIWVFMWCNISTLAIWQIRSNLFLPATISIISSQIILGGILVMIGNVVPTMSTTIAIISIATITFKIKPK